MKISIPGKIFVLGEYAALAGLPSVVAAMGPRFVFDCVDFNGTKVDQFSQVNFEIHPDSPAGRLLSFAKGQGISFEQSIEFSDPYGGKGGFGASTAQFVTVYCLLAEKAGLKRGWKNVWELYREVLKSERVPPSGADLVAQCQGGTSLFSFAGSPEMPVWEGLSLADSNLLVFSATDQSGRKVPTHDHLKSLETDLNYSQMPYI